MNSSARELSCGMFVEVHTPDELTSAELDAYLARGWFRMGQTIFTTNFAHVKDKILSTIWLRVKLKQYVRDRVHAQLIKRNAGFTTLVQPATLSEEKEQLFSRYRDSLEFTVSESLQHLLLGKDSPESIYTTYEVTVRDGDKLIACGFFDLGTNSTEGIVSFYDPDYKKYSLGKYLIYRKIQHSQSLGHEYFYPGYFVPGNPFFDYKLGIARESLQFLQLSTGLWCDLDNFSPHDIPADVMSQKLEEMRITLHSAGVESHVLKYEFFDAGLIPDMRNSGLFDFPIFLLIGPSNDEPAGIVVVYDVRDQAFHLEVCMPIWKPDRMNPDRTFYSAYFLKPVQEVYATPDGTIMSALIAQLIQKVVSEPNS